MPSCFGAGVGMIDRDFEAEVSNAREEGGEAGKRGGKGEGGRAFNCVYSLPCRIVRRRRGVASVCLYMCSLS